MEAATKAAAAGGITTVIDMPLNNIPPTTSGALVHVKLRAAKVRCAGRAGPALCMMRGPAAKHALGTSKRAADAAGPQMALLC